MKTWFKRMWVMAVLLAACAPQPVYRTGTDPLQSVPSVDLKRYVGRWYEIHRLPNGFEDADCVTVTADYALREDGLISVINTCVKPGEVNRAHGVARRVDPAQPGRLEVSFFRPFYGDYWIVDLTESYSAVLIAEPAGKYLWILGRTPALSAEDAARMLKRARELGYPVEKFVSPGNGLVSPGV